MITLFRWLLLKQKKIKCQLAFYTFLDQALKELDAGEQKDSMTK